MWGVALQSVQGSTLFSIWFLSSVSVYKLNLFLDNIRYRSALWPCQWISRRTRRSYQYTEEGTHPNAPLLGLVSYSFTSSKESLWWGKKNALIFNTQEAARTEPMDCLCCSVAGTQLVSGCVCWHSSHNLLFQTLWDTTDLRRPSTSSTPSLILQDYNCIGKDKKTPKWIYSSHSREQDCDDVITLFSMAFGENKTIDFITWMYFHDYRDFFVFV